MCIDRDRALGTGPYLLNNHHLTAGRQGRQGEQGGQQEQTKVKAKAKAALQPLLP